MFWWPLVVFGAACLFLAGFEAGIEFVRHRERKRLANVKHCVGYPDCDGDLVATDHSEKCPLFEGAKK